MKNFVLLLCIVFVSCKKDKLEEKSSPEIVVEKLTYDTLAPLLNKKDEKTYIVNFWATWCQPCVEELPYFEKVYENYQQKNVELILVSLDFPNQVEKRLIPFMKEHELKGKVVLMADPDQNAWISKINKDWTGAIPATIIYNKEESAFYERSFTYKELETELQKFLKTH